MKISLPRRHTLIVKDGAFSHKITMLQFLGDSKSWKASKMHYLFKSYGNFAELVDFAYWRSFTGGGSATEFLNVTVSPSCDNAQFCWLCAKFWGLYVQAGKFMIFLYLINLVSIITQFMSMFRVFSLAFSCAKFPQVKLWWCK